MREIKHKIWHNKRKEFLKEFSIMQTVNSEGKTELTVFERLEYNLEPIPRTHVVILGYTGLKDKNWKEIYEGDIVWDWNDIAWIDSYSKVEYDEEFSWYIVYTPWLITPLHEALEVWNGRDATTWKDICWVYVAWNIYENPNLLNND